MESKQPVSSGHASRSLKHPSDIVVRGAIALGIIAAVILLAGLGYGAFVAFGGPAGGTTPTADAGVTATGGPARTDSSGGNLVTSARTSGSIHVVAIGDSLAHGLGDASGRGFVGDVSQMYRSVGRKVVQSNLGIDGLTTSGLQRELGQTEVQTLLQSANVVLVSIGGNDLNDAAGLPNLNNVRIAAARQQFDENVQSIFTSIRHVNPNAPILWIGLYNPYGQVHATAQQTDAVVQSWNADAVRIAEGVPGAVAVQTFDLFQLHPEQFLYVDHFHPNQAGYARIANRIWQDLQTS